MRGCANCLRDLGFVKSLPLLAAIGVPPRRCRAGHQGLDREGAAAARGEAGRLSDKGASHTGLTCAHVPALPSHPGDCSTHKAGTLHVLFAQELGCQSLKQMETGEGREGEWRRVTAGASGNEGWRRQPRGWLATRESAPTYWRSSKRSAARASTPTVVSASSAAASRSSRMSDHRGARCRAELHGLLRTGVVNYPLSSIAGPAGAARGSQSPLNPC